MGRDAGARQQKEKTGGVALMVEKEDWTPKEKEKRKEKNRVWGAGNGEERNETP